MAERMADGRVITGHPTDVRGDIPFVTPEGRKALKEEMYKDFLLYKSKGDVPLDYRFDTWCNRSRTMLEGRRKADIASEHHMGKIGRAEFEALEETRIKMVEAIKGFDLSDLDMYGIQHLDLSLRGAEAMVQKQDQELTPTHRPGVVKLGPDPKGQVIAPGGK